MLRKRKKLTKRASQKNFSRVARKVKRKNLRKNLSRGGYSL